MSHLVDLLTSTLTTLPPALVLLLAFALPAAEASMFVGLVVPGETAVIVAGVLARAGVLPLWAVVVSAAAGAIVGDQVGFRLGRRLGPALLDRVPRWVRHRDRTVSVLAFVRRRGAVAVVVGRWTASLRALVPGAAGLSGVSGRTFTVANVVGGSVWATAVALIGYLAGTGYHQLEQRFSLAGGLAGVGLLVVAVIAWRVGQRRRPSRQEDASPAADQADAVVPPPPTASSGGLR